MPDRTLAVSNALRLESIEGWTYICSVTCTLAWPRISDKDLMSIPQSMQRVAKE